MLLPGSQLINVPVLSLQTGDEIARTKRLIINPDNLFIVAFELSGNDLPSSPAFLRIEDIREISSMGMIVDSHDEIVELDDIISLKNLYESGFEIQGIKVIDDTHEKIGKVDGVIINSTNFIVQQINVRRPLLRSLGDTEVLIHRGQIINVTSQLITVKRPTAKTAANAYSYVNPFRAHAQTPTQPDTATTDH